MDLLLDEELANKIAVYWSPGDVDEDAERSYNAPVEIRCAWNSLLMKEIAQQKKLNTFTAEVYLPQEVVVGGWIWLSSKSTNDPAGSALAEAPAIPPKKNQIRTVDRFQDVDPDDETIWIARL